MIKKAINIYKVTKKQPDYFWAKYITRPFASFFLACLDNLRITPNQLTLVSFIVGMIGNVFIAFANTHVGLWISWGFIQLAFTFDCMDGQLVRLKKMYSPIGLKLDFLIDEMKLLFLFPEIGYRLYIQTNNVKFILLTLAGLAIIASGCAMTIFIRSQEFTGKSGHSKRVYKKGLTGWIMRFLSLILNYPSWIILPVIFNKMDWFIYISLFFYALYFFYAWFQIVNKVGRYSHYFYKSDDNNRI